jgi:hypothetical protein
VRTTARVPSRGPGLCRQANNARARAFQPIEGTYKTVWLGEVDAVGEVEATDEAHAITKAAQQVPATKLIAVKRT